jgi:hypothetical protein
MLNVNNAQRFGPIFASVTLDGTANGVSVRFAPAGEDWQITNITVVANDTSIESQAYVSVGQLGAVYQIGNTQSGSSGDSFSIPTPLNDGTPLYVQWKNGKAGAVATATISGWKSVGRGGFRATY